MNNPTSVRWPRFVPADIIFESFTYPFFDLAFSADHRALASAFLNRPDEQPMKGGRGIYVHIPFCDTICGMCPFEKMGHDEETVALYMHALSREIELVGSTVLAQSWRPNSVYIGGGTPSVLGPDRAFRLISKLRSNFNLTDDVEVSFEVEPKSATPELFVAIKEAGVTRVSFGVQTLNPASRKMMNLTATDDDIARTVELSIARFANTNLDMIVGFPGQSVDEAIVDMHAAAKFGIGSISLYPMDYIAVLPTILNGIRAGKLPKPASGRARWNMFHAAREALLEHSQEQNMYCFGKPGSPRCRYMFDTLYGGYHDQCLGIGLAAYTGIRGLLYVNERRIKEYMADIGEGKLPIERTSPGHAYEKKYVYMPKRLEADLAEARELRISDVIEAKVEDLANAGFVTCSDDLFQLTDLGKQNYAQIMVGFLSDAQRRLYDGATARLTKKLNWDVEGATSSARAELKAFGGRNALPQNPVQ